MDVVRKFLPAGICAGLLVGSSTASGQNLTNDFFIGEYFPSNVIEVSDLLDPNDPTDVGPYNLTNPRDPSFHLRNYGAFGTDSNSVPFETVEAWWTLLADRGGNLVVNNNARQADFFFKLGDFTDQKALDIRRNAGKTVSGNPLLVLEGKFFNDADELEGNNSVGIGGAGFADLHVFDLESPALGSPDDTGERSVEIALDSFNQFWSMQHIANDSFPGTGGLFFYYDDFEDGQDFGASPVHFLPAPEATLVVGSDTGTIYGVPRVAIGDATNGTDAMLQVRYEEGASVLVQDTGPTASRTLFQIENNGPVKFGFTNKNTSDFWVFNAADNGQLRIAHSGPSSTPGTEFTVFSNGNATLSGALTQNSDVNSKQDIERVDAGGVLEKVMALPISEWSYRDEPGVRHMGPMAQDFYSSFQLGATNVGLSSVDTGGVALAAIQAIKAEKDAEMKAKDAEIAQLEAIMRVQEARLLKLEAVLTEVLLNTEADQRVSFLDPGH